MVVATVAGASRVELIVAALLLAALGCQSGEPQDDPPKGGAADEQPPPKPAPETPPLRDDVDVAQARPGLCERAGDDSVRDLFCSDERPTVTSLADLQQRLGFNLDPAAPNEVNGFGSTPYQGTYLVALGHSTALSGRLVSPLNPRVIAIAYEENKPTFLAFNRGVQQVEIAALDRSASRFNFYLVRFEQSCNESPEGCLPGDLFTPSIESDWQRVAVQDDEDLKNAPSDCRQCHQRGLETPMPLMRELRGPWTHFFAPPDQPSLPFPEVLGSDLSRDFLNAKGDEAYGGVAATYLTNTVGFTLQNNVSQAQPLEFNGSVILNERWPYSPEGYREHATPSTAWTQAFAAFKRGDQLALPYHAGRATDEQKQAQLTAAYVSYREGSLDAAALPDLADIYPDDPQTRAEIGLQNEPGATPAQLLVQACGTCHNDALDQGISRARFNIALGRVDPAERSLAIARLKLPRGSAGAMPPADARQLDADALAALQDYLAEESRASEDDELLEHAAQRGMAGPQQPFMPSMDSPYYEPK